MRKLVKYLSISICFFGFSITYAKEQVTVAVASNFLLPLQQVKQRFELQSGFGVQISSGSTAKLYAQLLHGAPFDIFLAADKVTPEKLLQKNKVVAGTLFQYASGTLVVYSHKQYASEMQLRQALMANSSERIAIANPKLAPYGNAAKQVLNELGMYPSNRKNIVFGENVGQAFQFVYSGNVKWGFVSLSQVLSRKSSGSHWILPREWYQPIGQYGVLLNRAESNEVARKFMDYLQSEEIQRILVEQFGYGSH